MEKVSPKEIRNLVLNLSELERLARIAKNCSGKEDFYEALLKFHWEIQPTKYLEEMLPALRGLIQNETGKTYYELVKEYKDG